MINTLEDYIYHSVNPGEAFVTNPNLTKKVDARGDLLPFLGNTVVFLLDDPVKDALARIQEELYRAAGDLLAGKLQSSTFHMTLHDLANGTPDRRELTGWMAHTEYHARKVLESMPAQAPLRMKATCLFNMVNTSIVLGLAPVDEDSFRRLDGMYMALESVVPLGYALTPHITMAYYRPGRCSPEDAARLAGALGKVELEVTLPMENLVLQNFTDMNHYFTIG